MTLVVLDTNVVVSALLNPRGTPAQVLAAVLAERVHAVYDARIVAEYLEVLFRPRFGLDQALVTHVVTAITVFGHAVVAPPMRPLEPDPTDTPFYEVAVWADALLVTGNTKHFPSDDPRIVTPAELIELLT
ncbi:MAG: putative toxin-antitoxin system toxin component, PIN family [Propionibacteriaceae bacterium]|jgi:putative PIN family toxin of toxin-antitoxin system|nr:putative toxin-antitoxin system toxin component, PIN family [Propionibacteriaceae bacterium]